MAILSGCCCCCSLKTGVITIAALNVIWSIFLIGGITNVLLKNKDVDTDAQGLQNGFNHGTVLKEDSYPQLIFGLSFSIIHAIASVLMLIGVIKEKAGLVFPWLILHSLGLMAAIVIIIFVLILLFSIGEVALAVVYAVIFSLQLSLSIYYVLVVFSFCQILLEKPLSESKMSLSF